jgi:Alw26I/Eco31I/Esp3I family type II restriction endonuclease
MSENLQYGSKGQSWHPEFIHYMSFIANHEVYGGMPDAFGENNKIQWEAPSNRASGKYKDTHHKRREWWRAKAISISISPDSPQWISRTAKIIHPTHQKPCKRCGEVMDLRYCYPSSILLNRLKKLDYINEDFFFDKSEKITDLFSRLYDLFGDQVLTSFPDLLRTNEIQIVELSSHDWLRWLEENYIPKEPKTLSPGAMSNAPDRFDGFHSFNQCCRGKADKGRSKSGASQLCNKYNCTMK